MQWLEEFNQVAGRIFKEYLGTSDTRDDVVDEVDSSGPQSIDLYLDVCNWYLNPVPSTRNRLSAIRHGSPARARWAAEEEPQRTARDGRECRKSLGFDNEPEMSCVERDGFSHIVDHVTDGCLDFSHDGLA
jgi:hypothetical protein